RDDYRLVENYRAEPNLQLSCPIHIINGDFDPEVTASRSAAWAEYTRAESHMRLFPGDHFYLAEHTAQVVAYLADILP
ncbi:MAG: thioesterase II family protein, partial [Mycobacterium sp.]